MPSGIDYSKWDKFAESSSSDEETHSEVSPEPRVTRLDEPGQVTRAADGTVTISPSSVGKNDESMLIEKKVHLEDPSHAKRDASEYSLLTKNGGEFRDDRTHSYVQWSQDRYEVTFRIYVDPAYVNRKNIKVVVDGIVPYQQKFSAVSSGREDNRMTVSSGPKILLQGYLPHFVYKPEDSDPDMESDIDWEIKDRSIQMKCPPLEQNETKFIQFDLLKASPMQGVQIWWSQPLRHCPSIDVSQIKERQAASTDKSGKTFKDAWEEAHKLFQEKMSQKPLGSGGSKAP